MNLKSIMFESNCQIEEVEEDAWSNSPSEIIINESVTKIGRCAFVAINNLKHIQFLGEYMTIESSCFNLCHNLLSISFPNAKRINLDVCVLSKSTKIIVKKDAELIGDINTIFKNQHEFIEVKE